MKRYRNNEIFGMTAEKVICDLYNLDYPDYLVTRSNRQLELKLIPYLRDFLKRYNINVVEYIGYRNDPEDFILENGETLSVKTNMAKHGKVCPQKIGQTTRKKWDAYFNMETDSWSEDDQGNEERPIEFYDQYRKECINNNPSKFISKYYDNLFCCDHMLYIYPNPKGIRRSQTFICQWIDKNNIQYPFKLDNKFTFTRYIKPELYPQYNTRAYLKRKRNSNIKKKKRPKWGHSTTIKYDGISIGEFQFHRPIKRNIVNFRFKMPTLLKMIN